jgi:hypothetical protein
VRIETGTPEDHPTPLPLDATATPGVQRPTAVAGQLTPADQGAVRDLTGERLGQLAASEAECGAAMSLGMGADSARRTGYAADISPLGASYDDEVALLPVTSDWSKHTGGSDATSYDPAG